MGSSCKAAEVSDALSVKQCEMKRMNEYDRASFFDMFLVKANNQDQEIFDD